MQTTYFFQPPVEVTTKPKTKNRFDSDETTNAQQAAITALNSLNTICNNAITAVNGQPLGPYTLKGSCTYDCSYDQEWWWYPDFRQVNNDISQVIEILNIASGYTTAFQPTKVWFNNKLPEYGTIILNNIATINKIDAAIIAAGGQETPSQKEQLTGAFNAINTALKDNLAEANNVFKSILMFVNNQNSQKGYLQTQVNNYYDYIKKNVATNEEDLIGKIACGANDVKAKFGSMLANISIKFAAMQTSFNNVNGGFQAALRAMQLVSGVFLILQSDSELVSSFITKAQNYASTSPLRKVELNIATNEWNDLVNEVKTQLEVQS